MEFKAVSFQNNSVQVKLEYGVANFRHNKSLIGLIALNCLAFIVMVFLNAASTIPSIGIVNTLNKLITKIKFHYSHSNYQQDIQ